ncbi:4-hydroxy-tetrahydrodipicolinate reductase [Ruminococcaceae bacterium OttesenSCG-928-I18]|nr:4-hydroxy-tetrahydrodipicolinate reductase [Ruminococcaceae bacterium OttesenSCG-928-I18]
MCDIVIQGACGRMGHALAALIAERDDCRVVAGIDAAQCADLAFPLYSSLGEMRETADVMIDFSLPEATKGSLPVCAEKNLPCVICTTGLDDEIKRLMQETAQKTAIFYSANMSLGINLLIELVRRAQKALPGFDIEIVEKHHHNKLDAPSGTALALADAINDAAGGRYHYVYDRHDVRQKRAPDEIGLHAVRSGSFVGQHEVLFAGPDEVVTLSHEAYSREVFANGAISAALFLKAQKPGMYNMRDLMGAL